MLELMKSKNSLQKKIKPKIKVPQAKIMNIDQLTVTSLRNRCNLINNLLLLSDNFKQHSRKINLTHQVKDLFNKVFSQFTNLYWLTQTPL